MSTDTSKMDEHSSVAENGQADGIGWMDELISKKYGKVYILYSSNTFISWNISIQGLKILALRQMDRVSYD